MKGKDEVTAKQTCSQQFPEMLMKREQSFVRQQDRVAQLCHKMRGAYIMGFTESQAYLLWKYILPKL